MSGDWDSPRAVLVDPPLRLERGQRITFRCTYDNFETFELVSGTTKGFDMCSLWNYLASPAGHGFEGLPPFGDSGGPRASELGACLSDLCPAGAR